LITRIGHFGKHAGMVPKDVGDNIQFRMKLLNAAKDDRPLQAELKQMCKEDMLFWVNAFGWTYDPRNQPTIIPMVTYAHQDGLLEELDAAFSNHDLCIPKSRDQGASWCVVFAVDHRVNFWDGQSMLLVSRNEMYVDDPGNSKSLFWKIDFIHNHLPKWMMPRHRRVKLAYNNLDNGSSIDGESTTGDVGRGDRRTAVIMDEFAAFELTDGFRALASTRSTSPCRIFPSTPQGIGNAFYEVAHSENIRRYTMHWSSHPVQAKGLYIGEDGRKRSPWYDNECKRAVNPHEIAQELDINFLGSDYQFFQADVISQLIQEHAREPIMQGDLLWERDTCKPTGFSARDRGDFKLWFAPDDNGNPPSGAYVVGGDISTGSGATPSVLSVANRLTSEKVAQFTSAHIRPEQFGRFAAAVCWWFHGAMLIPEANGPGQTFITSATEAGYRNFWYRENEKSLVKNAGNSLIPGWYSNKEFRTDLLSQYRDALYSRKFINHAANALREAESYVFVNGNVEHAMASRTMDSSAQRENHSDHVIADALAWLGIRRMPTVTPEKKPDISENPPERSLAYFRKLWKDNSQRQNSW
jgi:hypothetical protein